MVHRAKMQMRIITHMPFLKSSGESFGFVPSFHSINESSNESVKQSIKQSSSQSIKQSGSDYTGDETIGCIYY